ncbi:L,D-transpeptidase [Leptotrichia buccalis]|uniref:ErfK/YbiS/YcfS/YnhG family protein n=1 Tax=Leptotrichia buccalis (strain ATCC 14201 / DSM 1135 / JCM 12969 / NCTC 10249 / C-1013-b) TaxID=523794 RepID=C7NEQ5_LEPBD|nr:L,D-transpeptidase [Leptotrichia buccalis]ACV38416.1 ErfK/YbiS/YcfS/YnhG family protein [Leptotrichia buccalis C-1013-b]
MIKRTKLKKSKFFIAALTMLSIMSANSFSASKKSSQQKQQHTEWKQITLEPDLDGDGIKDKIDVEYAEMGGNIYLKFTPYVFTEKAKFEKGKQVEKTITKSDFEEKFDNFVKGFIAEYPKKNGGSQPAVTEQPIETQDTNAETPAPAVENKPEETATTINNKTDETDKKPVSQKKNTVNSEGNTENDKALDSLRESNMVKAQNTVLDNKNNDNSNNSAQNQNINSSYSYIKQYFGKRTENLTFNFGYDKHSPRDMDEFVFIKTATSIRKEPNSNAKVIKSATYSQKYKTTGIVKTNVGNKSDEWYEVFFDNQLGYIPKSAVEKREFDWNDMMKKVDKTNKFIKEAVSANKKIYVLDDYVPLGGGESGKRDKFGNRANQSEFGYIDKSFKDYINIPDRTIMVVEEENDKYVKVKIDAYDNGVYYLKPSSKKYLKEAGITGEVSRFIYVDRSSQNEMIIEKSGNGWNVVTSSFVTTGKDAGNSFATPYGTFLIAYSKPVMSYTGSGGGVVGDAKYAVRFSGGGYMHGIPSVFEPKNTREQRKAATAKKIGTYPESHKCIRHYDDQIKFIYEWLGNSSPGHSEGFRVPSVPTVMLVK